MLDEQDARRQLDPGRLAYPAAHGVAARRPLGLSSQADPSLGAIPPRSVAAEHQRRPQGTYARWRQHAHDGNTHYDHKLARIILTERVANPCRGRPTRSKGESGTVMLCWSLMVELAAWAGWGHQAGANRQATSEAGHRDGH